MLYQRLRGSPEPLFVFPDHIIPAASVWTGTRLWLDKLRDAGAVPGSRLVVSLPPSTAWIDLFLAALWEGYTFIPLGQDTPPGKELLRDLDPFLVIGAGGVIPDEHGLPPDDLADGVLDCRLPSQKEIRILAKSSGSTGGEGKWIAISDQNLRAVVDSHRPLLGMEGARVLSILPWNHLFGLVIEFLPALFDAQEIHRLNQGGRNIPELLRWGKSEGITHFFSVPLILERIAAEEGGADWLKGLRGGVVGGAPVCGQLASLLRGTALRVGYGQTEASPGICLGEPGEFFQGCMGRPVGCELCLDTEGVLCFRGPNRSLGYWNPQRGLNTWEIGDWHPTGDLAIEGSKGWEFCGRNDDRFKLLNGRMVPAGVLESKILRRLPHLRHVCLFSPDGQRLSLVWSGSGEGPEKEILAQEWGSLARLVHRVQKWGEEDFPLSPKGDPIRKSVCEKI